MALLEAVPAPGEGTTKAEEQELITAAITALGRVRSDCGELEGFTVSALGAAQSLLRMYAPATLASVGGELSE